MSSNEYADAIQVENRMNQKIKTQSSTKIVEFIVKDKKKLVTKRAYSFP